MGELPHSNTVITIEYLSARHGRIITSEITLMQKSTRITAAIFRLRNVTILRACNYDRHIPWSLIGNNLEMLSEPIGTDF